MINGLNSFCQQISLKIFTYEIDLKIFNKFMVLLGRNFGDDGLFFLAESLGYNQVSSFASFSAFLTLS